MGLFSDPRVEMLMHQVSTLSQRIEKLENDARYIADQPKAFSDGSYSAWYAAQNAYQNGILVNEVPINGVVKAIVKHLDMEIEKVAEHTINKPMEVKVVEKAQTTVLNTNGITGAMVMPNGTGVLTPKPKRGRPAKRKTK